MKILVKCSIFALGLSLIVSCASSKHTLSGPSENAYYNYMVAVEAEQSNDWKEAMKHLSLALEEDNSSVYLRTEISHAYRGWTCLRKPLNQQKRR